MNDVAAACGVSQATVSLVLSEAPGTRISPATRAAVIAKARELGYRRGRAGARRTGRPLVAMLINDVTCSPHVAGLVDGVSEAASELGLLVAVMPTAGDDALEAAAIDHLLAVGAAGFIYARLVTQEVVPPARLLGRPAVLLNCHAARGGPSGVVPADLAAGMTATLALLDAGHRRVAYIGGEDSIEASRERLKGYRRALASRDLPADPALVVRGGWTIAGGHAALMRLRALPDPPTAAFCFCDRTAVGVYNAAQELGLRIPDELSVVGFDNEAFTADMAPPLSTMDLPHADMARHAVEELARMMASPGEPPRHPRMKVDCPLVARRSVAPPVAALPRRARAAAG